MRKSFYPLSLSLVILLFLSRPSFAQQAFNIGVKGGMGIPNLSSSSSENSEWTEGFSSIVTANYGIIGALQFSPSFSLQLEVEYIGEGGKRSGIQPFVVPDKYKDAFQQAFPDQDHIYADFKNVSHINYIHIPVLAKYNFNLLANKRLKLFVDAGPFIGFLTGSKQHVTTDNLKVYLDYAGNEQIPPQIVEQFFGLKIDQTVEAKDNLKTINVGIEGNIGFFYQLDKKDKIFLQGGGNYGFIPVQKIDKHGKSHTGAATITIGYMRTIWQRKNKG